MELHRKIRGWGWQYVAASLAVAGTLVLVTGSIGPFDVDLPQLRDRASVWQVLLHDRWILGVLRVALTFVALYAIASIPALIIQGRWLRGFGSSGVSVDEAQEEVDESVEGLERQLELADRNFGEAVALASSLNEENDDLRKEIEELTQIIDGLENP